MIVRGFLPAFQLILLGATSHAAVGEAKIEPELELNVSTPVLITPTSSIKGRRQLPDCEDYQGKVFYNTPDKNGVETTCDEIKKKSWFNRCKRKLSANMNDFQAGARVRTACPIACGDCDSGGSGTTPTTPTTPSPPPNGGNNNQGKGTWGPLFKMTVIPIHAMLVPGGEDGVILSYGTTVTGRQRADLNVEAWNLEDGIGEGKAHVVQKNNAKTDLFCSNLNIDANRGGVLIVGGDTREPDNGLGVSDAQEYLPDTQQVVRHPMGDMKHPRWYPTSIILPTGDVFVIGGKSSKRKNGSAIPEVYNSQKGFTELKGATVPIIAQDGTKNHWWYPHTWVNSKGQIVVIMPRTSKGKCYTYLISEKWNGSIKQTGLKPFVAHTRSASIMFRVDTVVMIDDNGNLWVVDISDGNNLKWNKVNNVGSTRINASMALLPNGQVVIVGGCSSQKLQGNVLSGALYDILVWDPDTNKLTVGPKQIKSRMYHSMVLVTPYATVISAGGGAPGPERNQNGQEYFPAYMPNDKKDLEKIVCPKTVKTNGKFVIKVNNANNISRVTATKSGASSHTRNCDARWLDLNFVKRGNDLEVDGIIVKGRVVPLTNTIMLPGLWLISTIDKNGVPSKACLVGSDMNPKYLG